MMFSSTLFSASAHDAEQFLAHEGYQLSQLTLNDAFDSHCATYSKAEQQLLLLWDGKEEWLRVVQRDTSQEKELFFRWLQRSTAEQHARALHDALKTIRNFFSAHTHDEDETCCGCSHHHA